MAHVDALSRNTNITDEVNIDHEIFRIEIADWILANQLSDEKIKFIHEILLKKPNTEYEKQIHKSYKIHDGRIYKYTEKGMKWLVPKSMRTEIVRKSHDDFGHFGLEKTLSKVTEDYWFPNMKNYIEKYIKSCIGCLYHKMPKGKQPGFLHPIEKNKTPFHTIHLDHLGPFVRSTSGKKYIVVCVESFTKYTLLCATKDSKTIPVLRFLDQIIGQFGAPTRIITNKGTCYTSKIFREYCEKRGIKHIQNAVATPKANGQVERYNSTILNALSPAVETDNKWDRKLVEIQFAINNVVHSVTKRTPSELLFGYRPRSVTDAQLTSLVRVDEPIIESIQEVRSEVKNKIENNQAQQKERFDKKRKNMENYKVRDLVVVRKPSISDGQSRKLLAKYKGPFTIKKCLPNDRYVVKELTGSRRTQRKFYESVESGEHLKKWVTREDDYSTDDEEC